MAKKGGAPTKSEILAQISKDTELSRKQVSEVFESLNGIIKKSLRGNGLFTLPGLLKLKVVKRPATKAREGVNPFTGEKMTFKAKPASKKVRALPLKNLKLIRELTVHLSVEGGSVSVGFIGSLFIPPRDKSHDRILQLVQMTWKKWPTPANES